MVEDVLAIVVANVMAPVVALVVLVVQAVVLVETSSLSIDEREQPALEGRSGKEHNVHRHERLSTSL